MAIRHSTNAVTYTVDSEWSMTVLESLPTNPFITSTVALGAVIAALGVIWTKGIRPLGRWLGDAVRNLRRIADYMEQMIDFLTRERDAFRADIEEVKRQNAEGNGIHDELDRRLRAVEQANGGGS